MHLPDLSYVLAGLAAMVGETFGTVLGGGSFIIQPALLALGVPPHQTVANDICTAAFSSIAFMLTAMRRQRIDKQVAVTMVPPMAVGAIIGSCVLTAIPAAIVIWIILGVCSAGLIRLFIQLRTPVFTGTETPLRHWPVLAPLAGLLMGIYDGVSAAGSGMIMIILISLIFRRDMKTTVLMANVLSLTSTGVATISLWRMGLLDAHLLLFMIPGAVIAGWLGAGIVHHVPEKILRVVFAVAIAALVVVIVAARLNP